MPTSAAELWRTPERNALRELAARFATRELVPNLDRWEDDGEVPLEIHRRAAELGLLELGFPAEVGGCGDFIDMALVK